MENTSSGTTRWNALSLPIATQTDALVAQFPDLEWLTALETSQRLHALSKLLKSPKHTLGVARMFSPLLVDLCARWLDDQEEDEQKFTVFGLLLPAHEELYPVFARFLQRPSLANGPLAFVTRENAAHIPKSTLHPLLLAYHRIIEAIPHIHRDFQWPATHLQSLCDPPHPESGVRLLALRCFAFHVGMNEPARVKWEESLVGTPANVTPTVETGFGDSVNIWTLPLLDHKRVIDERLALTVTFDLCKAAPLIDATALCPYVTTVGGVILLRSNALQPTTPYLTFNANWSTLHDVARLLQQRQPILLSGSSSSGKSTLVEYLSSLLNHHSSTAVVSIHLADTSLDSRSLLGSYVSSAKTPGVFEWRDGAIIQAMRTGRVLVLENIDRASSEVLGMLWPLVESMSMAKPIGDHASLQVFGRETVRATEGFSLFATRTVSPSQNGEIPPANFLGSHKWRHVQVPEPSGEDLVAIVEMSFPKMSPQRAKALVAVWVRLRSVEHDLNPSTVRPIGLRDLLKWSSRINLVEPPTESMAWEAEQQIPLSALFSNPITREDIFLDAMDIFFGAYNESKQLSSTYLDAAATFLAVELSISSHRLQWLRSARCPQLELLKNSNGATTGLVLDRIVLSAVDPSSQINAQALRPFALHRPSLTLLHSLAAAIRANEPVLLVGETGTGKTTAVTHLATLLNQSLVSLNLSQQTETSDLVGGYKPLDARGPAQDLQRRFTSLFTVTFSREKNVKYEEAIRSAVANGKWKRAAVLWKEAAGRAKDRLQSKIDKDTAQSGGSEEPRKRRKLDTGENLEAKLNNWSKFEEEVSVFEGQFVRGNAKGVFAFVEGPLVTALKRGDWILLDEVNLASSETLEAISSILHSPHASITLTEQGSLVPVERHPNFRLFACMNPATDVGKKDLPQHIRALMTELYVPPPDANPDALLAVVEQYIGHISMADRAAIMDVAEFYTLARKMAQAGELADGSNQRPHYSMRTLTRALTFAVHANTLFPLRRALWEGCLMSFSTILEPKSSDVFKALALKHLLGNAKNVRSILSQIPSAPADGTEYISVGPFWLERGPTDPLPINHYILTPSVQAKLLDLARILVTRQFPVLIEGPTSSGKTSAIEYLARLTGHRFIRINNHEHTDIQEYLGSYVTNPETGLLTYQDGLLVRAVRRGDWIVLDELNLAPSDVLEALNRLLDDNRELVIPETGEVVRPHPHFMLFATQNPPGLYGGRKILSRAFRNRFLEVHFQDVPQNELEQIIQERCGIAPSYAHRIVAVYQELQRRRQAGRVFETKHGFATLRDLFRWANRGAGSVQELAEDGYMLIAEKSRREDDKAIVKEVIESVMKVSIHESQIYNIHNPAVVQSLACPLPSDGTIVWTQAMQRIFVLASRALRHKEPILLVGDTGSGKTSFCEIYSQAAGKALYTVNCHQNTETADLLGGQRPIRNRASLLGEKEQFARSCLGSLEIAIDPSMPIETQVQMAISTENRPEIKGKLIEVLKGLQRLVPLFEWQDGPLVTAMRSASMFLLDEISLADDSVLERLNSVLEPERTLVLAEKSGWDGESLEVVAHSEFLLAATMNPGGDHGKKELSPALRNRFTEIWVPPISNKDDKVAIVQASWHNAVLTPYSERVVDFLIAVGGLLEDPLAYGIRDLLAWVHFSDEIFNATELSAKQIFHHAAHLVALDGLAAIPQTQGFSEAAIERLRAEAIRILNEMVPDGKPEPEISVHVKPATIAIGSFSIPLGPLEPSNVEFQIHAPTTLSNIHRVVRALQLKKAILLEGSPGVGKTSLVAALAAISRQRLCRINLSDQTDIIDLFGSDLPVEGGQPGEFAWRNAAFLTALQNGDWVLLDEMNLAPQSVLEGLNAVLDHRGSIFVPELGRTFTKHPAFRLFAAQNPVQQGGGRKGLPKSFVNRFTKVFVDSLSTDDLLKIAQTVKGNYPEETLKRMIALTQHIHMETTVTKSLGRKGSPWEFNLRDLIRWLELTDHPTNLEARSGHPVDFVGEIFAQRFREPAERRKIYEAAVDLLQPTSSGVESAHFFPTTYYIQFGHSLIRRKASWRESTWVAPVLRDHLSSFEVITRCIDQGWLVILVGGPGSGKTTILRQLGSFYGEKAVKFSASSATDTSDLLGGFEQDDGQLGQRQAIKTIRAFMDSLSQSNPFVAPDIGEWLSDSRVDVVKLRQVCQLLPEDQRSAVEDDILTIETARLTHRFVWVDGPLVHALKEGLWFILDNANLCSPSVLDRLNSLCEQGGQLILTERGLINGAIETIQPHPNFRLFMTMDPLNGELSRAMRNRGVEVYVDAPKTPQDLIEIDLFRRTPLATNSVTGHVEGRQTMLMSHLSLSSLQRLLRMARLVEHAAPIQQNLFVSQLLSTAEISFLSHLQHQFALDTQGALVGTTADDMPQIGLPASFLQSQPEEIMLNPNLLARIRSVGLDVRVAWNTCRRRIYSLINAIGKSSRTEGHNPLHQSIFNISEAQFSGRLIGGSVAEEVKAVYPVLYSVRQFLESLMGSPVPVIDISICYTLAELWYYGFEIAQQNRLDYSSWISILCEMRDAIGSISDRHLRETLRDALESIRLKSGFEMKSIWMLHRDHQAGRQRASLALVQLNQTSRDSGRLFGRLVDIAALQWLNENSQDETVTPLLGEKTGLQDESSGWVAVQLLNLHLTMLGGFISTASIESQLLGVLCQLAMATPGYPMGGIITLSSAKWAEKLKLDHRRWASFSFGDWTTGTLAGEGEGKPGKLMGRYAKLMAVARLCAGGRIPMKYSKFHEAMLQNSLLASVLELQMPLKSHADDLISILRNDMEVLHTALIKGSGGPIVKYHDLASLMTSLNQEAREDSIIKELFHILGVAMTAIQDASNDQARVSAVAECYSYLAILVLRLYVPNIPLDPQASSITKRLHLVLTQRGLDSELQLHQEAERILTGNESNPYIELLKEQLNGVTSRLNETTSPQESIPRSLDELTALCTELSRFHDTIIQPTKFKALIEGLKNRDTMAQQREEIDQDSWRQFTERVEAKYPEFGDIVYPVLMWVNRLRFGVNLLHVSSGHSPTDYLRLVGDFAHTTTSFPALSGASRIASGGLQVPPHVVPHDWSVLRINASLLLVASGEPIEIHRALIASSFQQLFGLWQEEKRKADEEEGQQSSLYKQRKSTFVQLSEEEQEAQEFKQLFPEFEDVMSDPQPALFTKDPRVDTKSTYQLFMAVNSPDPSNMQIPDAELFSTRNLARWLRSARLEGDFTADTSVVYRIRTASHRLQCLHQERGPDAGYNFYHDSNVTEITRALKIVSALQDRLLELIGVWPDQMVLKHIKERCEAITDLDIESSVARVLSALEQLLLHTEDWQKYADRENSLAIHQEALSNLIVEWRRSELACWAHLLDHQATEFAQDLEEWWFRLYENFVYASKMERMDGAGEDAYLDQLLPLLESFVTSSPAGQYASRLELLKAFVNYIREIVAQNSSLSVRVAHLLNSVVQFYSSFRSKVSTSIQSQRESIDKEIKGFIKLASWKDINVLALKASAQRTHHQLHKSIRKFREVLRTPVSLLLSQPSTLETREALNIESSFNYPTPLPKTSLPQVPSAVGALRNIENTLGLYQDILNSSFSSPEQPLVEDFASSIVEAVAELQSAVAPADADKKRGWLKNLQNRKRKGLADLLKACKAAGLSSQPRHDITGQQLNRRWLFEQRVPVEIPSTSAQKMDTYFDKVIAALPKLHSSLSSHSSEVSTKDLSKLLHFSQSLLYFAIQSRSWVLECQTISSRLASVVHILEANGACQLSDAGNHALHRLSVYASVLAYATQSTQNIRDVALEIQNLPYGFLPFNFTVLKELEERLSQMSTLKVRIEELRMRSKQGHIILLFSDENNLLDIAKASLCDLCKVLKSWCEEDPRAQHLCGLVVATLEERIDLLPSYAPYAFEEKQIDENPLNVLLVIAQRLKGFSAGVPGEDFVKQGATRYRTLNTIFDAVRVAQEVDAFFLCLPQSSSATLYMQRLHPFLATYQRSLDSYFKQLVLWTKSLFKLCSILLNLAQDLADRGFCQPQDAPPDSRTDTGQKMEGTGVGEGSGDKDVTNEIEDDSQMEGLQGAEEEKQQMTESKEEGREMANDFEGDLEDVAQDENDGEDDNSDSDASEVEERAENLDPADPGAVDEKLWEGKADKGDRKEDQTTDQPSKEVPGESEVGAKRDDSNKRSQQDPKMEDAPPDTEERAVGEEDEEGEDAPDTTNMPNDAGAPMEDLPQDGEALELPDDLDMGEKGEVNEEEQGSGDMDELSEMADDNNEKQRDDDEHDMEYQEQLEATEDEPSTLPEENRDAIAQPDEVEGSGQQDTRGGGTSMLELGTEANADRDMDEEMHDANEALNTDQQPEGNSGMGNNAETEATATGEAPVESRQSSGNQEVSMSDQVQTTPRPVAEALSQVRRNYQEILERLSQANHLPADKTEFQSVEHAVEEDENTQLALGTAEDEIARLRDLNLIDETTEKLDQEDTDLVDLEDEGSHHQLTPKQTPKPLSSSAQKEGSGERSEEALVGDEIRRQFGTQNGRAELPSSERQPLTSDDVESRLVAWQNDPECTESAETMWRLYSSLTHDLAWGLCEQLRLTLEPTKATRLRGDYRTGKRLNMKKIIPYIASEYTKDKIWLRRTRPSQREYQILLALDDSRSMSESHSEHLSFETLALVSKALTRLEAGDISIVKFGESVQVLHGFDDGPFNDAAGARVMNSFTFSQTSTDVLALVETSISVLQEARERRGNGSSGAANLWQLEIIISDGICSNHDELRAVIRRAREQRILVVFIVVDALARTQGGVARWRIPFYS
ncbi:related to midasin (AAA ATPase) [Serendipita indica DSM 11827]|uniref:Midasin n=1 Tax=Serendipita indica (strain DSM 11827) TaxID=1109443 RepID=G4T682_SERID|nr:related to midasin (AAA ATPase) [Serendipita indica DSM 11827]